MQNGCGEIARIWSCLAVWGCRSPEQDSGDLLTCEAGEVLDGGACVPELCGTGTWGDLDLEESALYVDAGAGEGGDGSEDQPLQTISEALERALNGEADRILVAAGDYPERLAIGREGDGLTLEGRCAALVTVSAPEGEEETSALHIDLRAGSASVSGVSLRSGAPAVALQSGELSLEDVEIRDGSFIALDLYEGSVAHLARVSVEDTTPDEDGFGVGVGVFEGASMDAVGLSVVNSAIYGVYVVAGSLTLTDFEVREVSAPTSGRVSFGAGLALYGGDHTLASGELADVEGVGLLVKGVGTMGVSALSVHDISLDDPSARCVSVASGGVVTWEGGQLLRCARVGLTVSKGADVTLRGVQIEDVTRSADGVDGIGILTDQESALSLESVSVNGAGQAGIYAADDSVVSMVDVGVSGTAADHPQLDGLAIYLNSGASLVGEDVRLVDNAGLGVVVDGASASLSDLEVSGEYGDPTVGAWGVVVTDGGSLALRDALVAGTDGTGVYIQTGASLELIDSMLERSRGYGLYIDDSSAILRRVWVLDTSKLEDFDAAGGVGVNAGGELDASELSIDGAEEVGLIVQDSRATLSELKIRDVSHSSNSALAVGLAVQGADVSAQRVSIESVDGIGVYGTADSNITCAECALSDLTFVGAMVREGSSLTFGPDSTITAVRPDDSMVGGVGIYVDAANLFTPTLTVLDSLIDVTGQAALLLTGPGVYSIEGSTLSCALSGPLGDVWPQANAVFATGGVGAWDGSRGLLIEGSTLEDNEGGAVFLDSASALIQDDVFQYNTINLVQQRCAGTEAVQGADDLEDVELCPEHDRRVELDELYLYIPTAELEPG